MGNQLMFFALMAVLELALANGYAILEHPAEPENDAEADSIWKVSFLRVLLALPQVSKLTFAQGLMGSSSPKPTTLLLVNLPNLLSHLHAGRIRKDLPRGKAIGKNASGIWHTTALKEYAPALCRAMSNSLFEAFVSDDTDSTVSDPPADFISRCSNLVKTTYGVAVGADFAG